MATALKTTTQELGESRVRLDVQVDSGALEKELQSAASALGREMRVPGFRKGKVPPQVVIQQVGREAVLDEAVRRALPGWYEEAVSEAGIATVGDPKLDLQNLPEKGAPLAFTIEVGVRPKAKLGTYKGVEVGRREPQVSQDEVRAELERLRESLASLETVDREASDGDFAVLDFTGSVAERRPDGSVGPGEPFEGGEARGYLLELGSGRLVEGFEEQLRGAKGGEQREVKVRFPDEYPREQLAGKDAVFAVEVKEVKEKKLPELDDDFAVEAGGYDSLDELRSEIESRIAQAEERNIEAEFREAAVDAVVAQAKIEVPHELVHSKAHEMWHRTARRLQAQGIDPAQYLAMTGKEEEELVTESEPEAETALKREAVLAAIVEAEQISPSDDELLEALAPDAERNRTSPKKLLERIRTVGRIDALREDVAHARALDLVTESATPIDAARAEAREKLWTPGN